MKFQYIALGVGLFLLPFCLKATGKNTPSLSEALKLSIDQQLLVHNLSNTYLMLCHDPRATEQYKIRASTVERFEEQLYQLSLLVPTPRIRENIQQVRGTWQEYKKIVDWSIDVKYVKKMIERATELQGACKMLFAAYREYEYGFKRSSDLVTVNQYIVQTYQQKLLLAQMTTYYIAHQLTPDDLEYKYQLTEFRRTFMRSLVVLQRAETGAEIVGSQLVEVENEWKAMEKLVASTDRGIGAREEWMAYVGSVLQRLNLIIERYEELSERISMSHAVETSIEQTIHIQKIASAYLTHMADVNSDDHYEDLLQNVDKFEQGLEALAATAGSYESIERAVRTAKILWKNYKNLATHTGERDELRAIKLLEQCHVLTAACDRIEQAVEEIVLKDQQENSHDPIQIQVRRLHRLQVYAERIQVYRQMTAMNLDPSYSGKRHKECCMAFQQLLKEVQLHQSEHPTAQKHFAQVLDYWKIYDETEATPEGLGSIQSKKQRLASALRQLARWYDQQLHVSYVQQSR